MLENIIIPVFAGLAGGMVNAAAGGAKLFVFPLLLASGLSPLAANVTAAVALFPSPAPAAWVFRHELPRDRLTLFRLLAPVLLGAIVGILVLVGSSERAFVTAIPFLLVIAVTAILFGNQLRQLFIRYVTDDHQLLLTTILLFGCGFYGGYFGAGLGFMLLAVLGAAGIASLKRANALKLLMVMGINVVVIIPIALSGLVDWTAALGVLVGGLAGGYLGARITRRLPEKPLRFVVVVLGVLLTVSFLLR